MADGRLNTLVGLWLSSCFCIHVIGFEADRFFLWPRGFGGFAVLAMLLAKIGTKNICCSTRSPMSAAMPNRQMSWINGMNVRKPSRKRPNKIANHFRMDDASLLRPCAIRTSFSR